MGMEKRYNEYYHGPKPGLTRTFPQIYNVSHPSAGGAAHIEREDFVRSCRRLWKVPWKHLQTISK
jgi:hypothetical protein